MIKLLPLKAEDREQFITDNQEAFKFGALEEFGTRDEHFEDGYVNENLAKAKRARRIMRQQSEMR